MLTMSLEVGTREGVQVEDADHEPLAALRMVGCAEKSGM
jgi:hypothetical protein